MASAFEKTVSATEFKATCLELMDQLDSNRLTEIVVTKRGRPVARVLPAEPAKRRSFEEIYGCLKGTTGITEDFDWSAPSFDEAEMANMDRRFREKFAQYL